MTKTIEEQYQKKTPIEHILLRPDTYIGSVEPESLQAYTMAGDNIEYRTITYVPGLFKIFDEIIVNAADNKIRDPSMKCIKVNIENDTISVYNDGKGIPVVLHKTEKVYIPELIFGQLLTSSNYDDKEKKITGGRNGYGAKLCNIFSDEFIVETSDGKKEYKQVFQNNMSVKQEPVIKSCYKEYTRITFKPDYKRFGMTHLDDDTISLLKKRVYDLCGTVKNIRVYYNDVKIEIKNFKEYCMMYLKKNNEETIDTKSLVHAVVNDRWEVVFYPSEDQFQQVSFVNSICTLKGGTHVSHVLDQLVDPVIEHIKKKEKGLVVKPMQVKSNMFLFINCLIVNPSFDSQTKENLTLNYKKFGSKCEPMDDFVKNILKSGTFLEKVVRNAKAKQSAQLKKTDGTKTSRLTGVPKLDDANMAGTKLSHRCTLILTEGDSAKALAVSGLSVVGRDYYGVFPLRGKMLNVRDAAHKQIMENNEIIAIKKILGLKHGEDYTTVESLRYGHIMIMTDQDHDGSHIKGLLINFLDHFYPSLLKIEGFLQEFITPIVRVTLKKDARSAGNTIDFFTLPEFYKWQEETPDSDKYKVKYYKGLGTSTSQDAKYYFSDLPKHVKNFTPLVDADKELLSLAFAKKRADARKNWLKDFVPGTYLDNSISLISISDFVNKELILFSMADNIRSIPSVVDGLKPGQRKVIFSCFKRKLSGEIKVAQLAGYVSEHSAYHHGEQSLCSTIVNLAQNYVGSNNINLLVPAGQFGTRLQGGKDAASSRYIFTFLERLTRIIFNEQDDNILNYNNEDNQSIEPDFYMPIIPMVLVNGAEGIGTGWSTSVPNYNVLDIVDNLRRMLKDQEPTKMKPWYRGFKGQIVEDTDKKNKTEEGKTKRSKKIVFDEDIKLIQTESPENSPSLTESIRYKISGIYDFDGDSIEITELPVGVWTQNYKEFLESLVADGEIKDFKEYHTENTVHFKIKNSKITANNVEKKLKLTTTISANNIVCFDRFGFIKRYANPEDILKDFYSLRLEYYTKRKEFMLKKLFDDLLKMENRVRFIKEVIDETLVLKKRKKDDIEIEMLGRKYDKIENSYDYLLNMPLLSLTVERIDKLNLERTEKRKEYDCLLKKSNKDLWNEDLDSFVAEYKKWLNTFVEDEKPVKAIGGRKRRTAAK